MTLPETHFVNGNPLLGPFLDDVGFAIFGLGCFWAQNANSGSAMA